MAKKANTELKSVLGEVYELLQDSVTSKADILSYIQTEQERDEGLSDVMGEVTTRMVNKSLRSNADEVITPLGVDSEGNIRMDISKDTTTKTLKEMIIEMPTNDTARFLIDNYYKIQKMRLAVQNQVNMLTKKRDSGPIDDATKWLFDNLKRMESDIAGLLKVFTENCYLGKWATEVHGVGPVIAAGLIAHLEIQDVPGIKPSAGQWMSYCGLNDKNRPWLGAEKSRQLVNEVIEEHCGKGEITDLAVGIICQRTGWKMSHFEERARDGKGGWSKDGLIKACSLLPYNQKLKTICYHFGESIIKQQNSPKSLYGKLFKERLAYENANNDKLLYKDQADAGAARVGKSTVAYKYYSKGQLPPAHIVRRAMRWTEKMFISHLFEAAYYNRYGCYAPEPYVMAVAGHKDYIGPEIPYDSFDRDAKYVEEYKSDIAGVGSRQKDAFRIPEIKVPKKRGRKPKA